MAKPKNQKHADAAKKTRSKNIEPDQADTDKVGQPKDKPLTLKSIEKILNKQNLIVAEKKPGKRIYRKNIGPLSDPDKGPTASINRLAKQLSPRVYEEHRLLFNKCAEKFPNKREALERAIELLAQELDLN
ncbi:MAG: hypothetical protein JKY55_06515 [Aliivibrio sp.]|uniref:hypothetical protein n=1 Tax=Aliivibrio sp. TaxID=1872443 RepID=UPI001A4C0ECF|nr:hypothetical protein [Aliivibrio sp.]